MRTAELQTRCECQATLGAQVDESHRVVTGWGRRRSTATATAPAYAVGTESQRFDVSWLCPFCGRNTLRSFDSSALTYVEPKSA